MVLFSFTARLARAWSNLVRADHGSTNGGKSQTVVMLAAALGTQCSGTRLHAARRLAELGTVARDAIPALVGAARDRNRAVRLAARSALRRIELVG